MKRREFIIALAGTTLWPNAMAAQEVTTRIVGVLGLGPLESSRRIFAPGLRRLAELGYVEGRNLIIEYS